MDGAHFAAGQTAYQSGDFEVAAQEFLAAAQESPGEAARAYHQAGNALLRLKRYDEAVSAYRGALEDASYVARSGVFGNLGTALSAAGRTAEALEAFDSALTDPGYRSTYKALQGRAGALFELGRYEEAATAYREAAWADGNPDPGRALNNLGLTFMALDRPQDAIEAYKAAIGVDSYSAKGRASVNLALAYADMGFFEEALREFDEAEERFGYVPSGEAAAVRERLRSTARDELREPAGAPPEPPEVESVEGWVTGQMPVAVAADQSEQTVEPTEGETDERETRFFSMSEAEMRVEARKARKAERRAARTPARIAARVAVIVAIVVVLAGAAGGAIYLGYGYPTQEQTVDGMLQAYRGGRPYAAYWVAVPQGDVAQEMRQLPARFASFKIVGVDRSALTSTARISVTLETGTPLAYDILLVREGVGWKVDGIRNTWNSTEG